MSVPAMPKRTHGRVRERCTHSRIDNLPQTSSARLHPHDAADSHQKSEPATSRASAEAMAVRLLFVFCIAMHDFAAKHRQDRNNVRDIALRHREIIVGQYREIGKLPDLDLRPSCLVRWRTRCWPRSRAAARFRGRVGCRADRAAVHRTVIARSPARPARPTGCRRRRASHRCRRRPARPPPASSRSAASSPRPSRRSARRSIRPGRPSGAAPRCRRRAPRCGRCCARSMVSAMVEEPVQALERNVAVDLLEHVERARDRLVVGGVQPPRPAVLREQRGRPPRVVLHVGRHVGARDPEVLEIGGREHQHLAARRCGGK